MRDFFVGVDVSKAELVCRVLDEKGQEQGKGSFANGWLATIRLTQ